MADTVILRPLLKCPAFFTSRKVLKITNSVQKRVFKLLFFKATKKTLGADLFLETNKMAVAPSIQQIQ